MSWAPEIVGIATWYPAQPISTPPNTPFLLLAAVVAVPLLGLLIWLRFRSFGINDGSLPPNRDRKFDDWLTKPPVQSPFDDLTAEEREDSADDTPRTQIRHEPTDN